MLDIILKLLSIVGILLLIVLLVAIIVILLVLLWPVTYKVFGRKDKKDIDVRIKADWLFGLLRLRFFYPQPGNIVLKILWITLYDSSKEAVKSNKNKVEEGSIQKESKVSVPSDSESMQQKAERMELSEVDGIETEFAESKEEQEFSERIGAKCDKIKYTFLKIYDKIKHILENISFYKELFQDTQTKELLHHGLFRLGRILKSIRPRKLKGNIIFGTGSPDTTGYAYGIYGMASAWLGNDIYVSPDFTQAILEGEIYASGHITLIKLLWHSVRVLLDKRLRLLLHRIKTHKI